MSATALDFPDNHFDFIFSNAVFEHINDPDKAASEVARVLKPGGVFSVLVHLFPSLSGGHNLDWSWPDESPSKTVPPCDHLRQNLYPTHAYLNKLRERDFLEIFSKHFTVLNATCRYEGERLLTPEIEKELSAYTRDDLLKRTLRAILTKGPART